MEQVSGSSSAQLAEDARTALADVSDPSTRAALLAALAVVSELQVLNRSAQGIEAHLKQVNQYLGGMANKP
ncbi:hypothetical protein ACIRP0_21800 [Streptomyces sp. NPDC101733]|uniref:hypothetical protein n=1 Tax=unclassified Streptomyces TaxID=2593676 RepID=UPI0034128E36